MLRVHLPPPTEKIGSPPLCIIIILSLTAVWCFLFSCSDALRKNLDCENGASAFQAQTGSKAETERAPCALGSPQTPSLFSALSHARERQTFNLLLFRSVRSQILLCAPSVEFTNVARRVGGQRTQFAYARAQNYTLSALWRKLMGVACYSGEIRDVSLERPSAADVRTPLCRFSHCCCAMKGAFQHKN